MMEIALMLMMTLGCDITTFNELEYYALNNSTTIEEMLEEEFSSYMRRYYNKIKIKNVIARYKMKACHDTRNG